MKTDFEIAREATLEPIYDIAAKAVISAVELETYGKHIAKLSWLLQSPQPKAETVKQPLAWAWPWV